jgi:hypothetical protein
MNLLSRDRNLSEDVLIIHSRVINEKGKAIAHD